MIASCSPRKLEAGLMAMYSKSSDFRTSTMKSPPLLVWVAGSEEGGSVSAIRFGATGLAGSRAAAGAARAAMGGVSAAAPASVAPVRKLRRRRDGGRLSFDIDPPLDGLRV